MSDPPVEITGPAGLAPDLLERLRAVRLIVFDVDGTLTDGSVALMGGEEIKTFNIHDGVGLALLREAGISIAWVTGRDSRATERRAAELRIDLLRQGVRRKAGVVSEIAKQLGHPLESVAAMGDDLQDLPMFAESAVRLTVADAAAEVRAVSDWISTRPGGRGAAREAAELILKAQGVWEGLLIKLGLCLHNP